MRRDLSPHIAGGYSRSVPTEFGKEGPQSLQPHPLAITCNTISNQPTDAMGKRTGLPSRGRLPENKHAGRDGPARRSEETMHGQTCMASAADNGVDQDFDQDRDPASVAGRPGRATAPAVPERLWPTDRFAPDRDRDLCAVAPRLLRKGRQRFPFHSGGSPKSPHARNT